MSRIAVALSGGGNRAALFGLGVLLYLVDAGTNADVVSVSSVSGGSLTNGFVGQRGDFPDAEPDAFRRGVRPFAHRLAHRTLWSEPEVWAYLAGLALLFGAAVLSWLAAWPWWVRLLVSLALLLAWGVAIQSRGLVVGRAIGRALFSPEATPTALADLAGDVDHVICATHLHAGEHVYFSGGFVYAYRFGWGEPADLPLHAAVQASAAFPGAFPPRWMRTRRFGFRGGRGRPAPLPRLMALADGGVYDNMADQWPTGVRRRADDPNAPALRVPDELVVVNASAGLGWKRMARLHTPLVGEVAALKRDIDILYDNSATLRRRMLVDRFRSSEALDGALVHIEQSPYRVPRAFEESGGTLGERARAVLERLTDEEGWQRTASANAAVATTLSALGEETAARLIRHGYVLALANLHVLLAYPLVEVPAVGAFRLVVGEEKADG